MLIHIFQRPQDMQPQTKESEPAGLWLLHGKPSGRTVLCEAGIPMRKSGEKPYLEGIASAPSTGPHSINGGSGNRAALQTAARPFLILLKKVRKGPKQSKAGVLHHAGFCMDSHCFLGGVFPKRRCSCAFAEVASAFALAERSSLRGGRAGLHGGQAFFRKAAVFVPRRFPLFVFVLGSPRFVSWPVSGVRRAACYGASRERDKK